MSCKHRAGVEAQPDKVVRHPQHRRLNGPQSCSGQVWKISFPSRFKPWTVQPTETRYTYYADAKHFFVHTWQYRYKTEPVISSLGRAAIAGALSHTKPDIKDIFCSNNCWSTVSILTSLFIRVCKEQVQTKQLKLKSHTHMPCKNMNTMQWSTYKNSQHSLWKIRINTKLIIK
jgi:hypothetical protein